MKTINHVTMKFGATLLLLSILNPQLSTCFAQGSLTPPGAPAPTMKTLDQLEPRIDLANAPAAAVTTTDASAHFIINLPGSYFLSANLSVTKGAGIKIAAEGVTLDLRGFEIARGGGGVMTGIEVAATSHRAVVRDGTLRSLTNGLNDLGASSSYYLRLTVTSAVNNGIGGIGTGATVDSCRVTNCNGTNGILVGPGSTVVGCTVTGNLALSAGISTLDGCSVLRCVVANNTVNGGIVAGNGCLVSECVAHNNTSPASSSIGISAGGNSRVMHCTASAQKTTAATPTNTTGTGITVGGGSAVEHCVASGNQGDGIRFGSRAVARFNQCDSNGTSGDGAGVHATGLDNCIDSNNVTNNDRGIDVDSGGNFIVRNTASGNPVNYSIVAANRDAQVLTPGTAFVSTDPWANFAY